MTDDRMALCQLVEKSSDADLVREMIGFAAERLMELEVQGLTGAAYGERSFWQGQQVGSLSSAVPLANKVQEVRIGSRNHGTPSYLNGWLDELRVTKGVARYGGSFVPPRGPFSRYKALGVARAARPATIGTALGV